MRAALVVAAAFVLAVPAAAGDRDLLAAKARYLPAAQGPFAADADGWQARYDRARDLDEAVRDAGWSSASCRRLHHALLGYARAQIRIAEAADYPVPLAPLPFPTVPRTCTPGGGEQRLTGTRNELVLPAGAEAARGAVATDVALTAQLAAIGGRFRGWAGLWTHDLATGRTAGWNSDAIFPAGSGVKLGAIVAGIGNRRLHYDVEQIAAWSSNLAANRIVETVGVGAVSGALRRLGMSSSTYPGLYRAGTSARIDAPKPPPRTHTRNTTARDLGRALYGLHAAAVGNRLALRNLRLTRPQARWALALLLASKPLGDNAGLIWPWLPRATIAQKNAWLSDLRATAALVFTKTGPVVVVVEAYREGITTAEARALGREVVRVLRLEQRSS